MISCAKGRALVPSRYNSQREPSREPICKSMITLFQLSATQFESNFRLQLQFVVKDGKTVLHSPHAHFATRSYTVPKARFGAHCTPFEIAQTRMKARIPFDVCNGDGIGITLFECWHHAVTVQTIAAWWESNSVLEEKVPASIVGNIIALVKEKYTLRRPLMAEVL